MRLGEGVLIGLSMTCCFLLYLTRSYILKVKLIPNLVSMSMT
jgi:hypothetical protein